MTGSILVEQPLVAFAVVLVAQCTVVTSLALLLAPPRCGAAYRAMVLRIGLYCALLCPVLAAGLIASGIHWITICVRESNSPSSPQSVPIEAENTPIPEFHPPLQSAPQPIAETVRTHFIEPKAAPSTKRSLVARNAPQESTSDSALARWALSAVMLWAAGFFAGLVGICRSAVKLSRILHAARPIDGDRLQAALKQVESTLSATRPLRVVESPHVNSPVAAGLLRTAIVLPQGLLDRVSPDELRAILLHEGAHVIRGDHLTLLQERLLAAAFWFHPLVHLLIRRLDRAREEVCDNYVLQSVDAASYSETLLRLMQLSTDATRTGLAVGLLPARWRLDERISGLLNEGRNTMIATRKTGKLFIACALTFCALAVGTARVTAQPESTPSDLELIPEKSSESIPSTAADESFAIPAVPSADDTRFFRNRRTRELPANSASEGIDLPRTADPFSPEPTATIDTDSALVPLTNRHARIASVDMNRLIKSTTKFQRRTKALEQKIADAEVTLQQLLEEQESLQIALAAIPRDKEEARTALQRVIDQNEAKIQQSKNEAIAAVKQDEAEVYLDIYREARDAIRMYADYYKVELVLQMESKTSTKTDHPVDVEPGGGVTTKTEDILRQINRPVVYASGLDQNAGNIDDITDAILDYLNKRDQRGKKSEAVDANATR